MTKKSQDTAEDRRGNADCRNSGMPDKSIVRYIVRVALLLILFVWALLNLETVAQGCGKVLALFFPFLLGGGIASSSMWYSSRWSAAGTGYSGKCPGSLPDPYASRSAPHWCLVSCLPSFL